MSITINYQKRKNNTIFNKFQTNKHLLLTNIQNYIPIYDNFFSLNDSNYNSINLNHNWFVSDINEKKHKKNNNNNNETNEIDEHIFNCKIKHSLDDNMTDNQKVFIKIAPLLDPFKYLVGKYNHTDINLFNLPSMDKSQNIHSKILNSNNSSYVDGFFSFLSSKTLHEHKFIHGIDYYGSFLCIKNQYKLNVMDDIEYLVESEFFNKQKDVLFSIEDYSHLLLDDNKQLKPLNIDNNSEIEIDINDCITLEVEDKSNSTDKSIDLNDVKIMNIDLVDITTSNEFNTNELKKSESLKSGSSCSSRTSHTDEDDEDEDDDDADADVENDSKISNNSDNESDIDSDDMSSFIDEEPLYATFPKFPVQAICMEQCENTIDYLIINDKLSENEWFSSLMQIIMTLITYQKMFSFTHNDLHTNNIMYVPTNKKHIYYFYNKKYYKVPTYGKIYKIIDFGRAIYKFNGKTLCSDSFQIGGDASTQYNTEPYFNENKPRLEPNYSFDLCRLACSIFDYIIDDLDDIKNLDECEPIVKLINEWCMDDNGLNVLYKTNGNERYPDFKLYKMIARCVHKHTPQSQLDRPEFSKFVIPNSPKGEQIFNIDTLPSYI